MMFFIKKLFVHELPSANIGRKSLKLESITNLRVQISRVPSCPICRYLGLDRIITMTTNDKFIEPQKLKT
jgi:hypothetical protein